MTVENGPFTSTAFGKNSVGSLTAEKIPDDPYFRYLIGCILVDQGQTGSNYTYHLLTLMLKGYDIEYCPDEDKENTEIHTITVKVGGEDHYKKFDGAEVTLKLTEKQVEKIKFRNKPLTGLFFDRDYDQLI